MCSIAGFISQKPLEATQELLGALLYYGQNRGKQSSGVWANGGGKGLVYKRAVDPVTFIQEVGYQEVTKVPATMGLVHTRQPTSGSRQDDGAQPFFGEKAVLIHNGIFSNHQKLQETFELPNPTGVDSELALQMIEKNGPKSITRFLWQAFGSTALAFVYGKKMYLVRDGNPLETATISGGGNTFTVFASTEDQIFAAVRAIAYIQLGTKSDTLPYRALCRVTPNGVDEVKSYGPSPIQVYNAKDYKSDYSRGYGYGLGQQGIKRYGGTDYDDYGHGWPDSDNPANGNGHKRNESPTVPAASNGHAIPQSEAVQIVKSLLAEDAEKQGNPE